MESRVLGRSDLRVSLIGLGCGDIGGRFDLAKSRRIVDKALDLGITFLDTADRYALGGSEEALGLILEGRRKNIVLATKFGRVMDETGAKQGGSRGYVISAVEASLRRLRTDWIDLYQMHVPDPATPIDETLRALDDLVRQGKVRHVGCSNFSTAGVDEAVRVATQIGFAGFVSCQNPYNVLEREAEAGLLPIMRAHGLALLPYYPLAGGMLSGRYRRDHPPPQGSAMHAATHVAERFLIERNFAVLDALQRFCAARGRTTVELAFSWLARQQTVASIIAGASSEEQLEQNVRAVEWNIGADEEKELDKLTKPV
jgi:aryl-alcohol dehydrogenase-like predicted oxidoreductase